MPRLTIIIHMICSSFRFSRELCNHEKLVFVEIMLYWLIIHSNDLCYEIIYDKLDNVLIIWISQIWPLILSYKCELLFPSNRYFLHRNSGFDMSDFVEKLWSKITEVASKTRRAAYANEGNDYKWRPELRKLFKFCIESYNFDYLCPFRRSTVLLTRPRRWFTLNSIAP